MGWAAALAVADALVVGALLLRGVSGAGMAVRAGLLWLGALVLAVLAGAVVTLAADHSRAPEAGGPSPEPARPEGLEELTRLVDGCRSSSSDAAQFTDRLQPLLLQLAVSRLGHPATTARLRAALGEAVAALLLAERTPRDPALPESPGRRGPAALGRAAAPAGATTIPATAPAIPSAPGGTAGLGGTAGRPASARRGGAGGRGPTIAELEQVVSALEALR